MIKIRFRKKIDRRIDSAVISVNVQYENSEDWVHLSKGEKKGKKWIEYLDRKTHRRMLGVLIEYIKQELDEKYPPIKNPENEK